MVTRAPVRDAAPSDSFFGALLGDGRPLLLAVAGALAFAGGFALFLSVTGDLLPQEVRYLGMTPAQLCDLAGCRIYDFMVHDRAAWGGAMLGVAILWTWLIVFPLRDGQPWAWWALVVAGVFGFGSFLGYFSYAYLDAWHALGVGLLVVVFATGLVRARHHLAGALAWRTVWRPAHRLDAPYRLGWVALLLGAAGTALGGATILWVGVTDTFVPEDLRFMGLTALELRGLSDRLVPLLAHDRIGFGGAVTTMGVTTTLCLWFGGPSRHLFQAISLAGGVSLAAAIGVHLFVGYTDVVHLLPAVAAAADLLIGLLVVGPWWLREPTGERARG